MFESKKKENMYTPVKPSFTNIKLQNYNYIGYNSNVMRHSACLVINTITVDYFAALFNYTPADWATDSMIAPT